MINLGAPEYIRSNLPYLACHHERLFLHGVRVRQVESNRIRPAHTGDDPGAAWCVWRLAGWSSRNETLPPQNREMDFQTEVRSGAAPVCRGDVGLVALALSVRPFNKEQTPHNPTSGGRLYWPCANTFMNALTKATVLVLNRNWQAINVRTP